MTSLNLNGLKDKVDFEKANIKLPTFDIEKTIKNTKENPQWLHFGAGNIFRGFIANGMNTLLEKGIVNTGIIAVETFDNEIIDKIYKPCDNLTILVKMSSDGKLHNNVVAGIAEGLSYSDNVNYIENIFKQDSLQIVSFTITEKGYSILDSSGNFLSIVQDDINNGPDNSKHLISVVTSLLYKRFTKNAAPIAMVSMDNCSHNGDKLKESVVTVAKQWLNKNFVTAEFIDYITDDKKVSFPLSMIDKITPRPADKIKDYLTQAGFSNMDTVITSKNTYIAPFVNAEITEYLIVEDKFPNGRPNLEEAGFIFTDRNTVNNVETMKVTTCLNPLHTALAVTGCILGYDSISSEMNDNLLVKLIKKIGYDEGLKVVVDPKIISPKSFIDEVVNERFANPNIPDTPQRIATDTSQKVGIRYGETIKKYMVSDNLNADDLVGIPLAIAMWCRYLVGVDDNNNQFTLSSDPMMTELQEVISTMKLGEKTYNIKPILTNNKIFDFDLYKTGLGLKIEEMFKDSMAGTGAVKKTLEKYL